MHYNTSNKKAENNFLLAINVYNGVQELNTCIPLTLNSAPNLIFIILKTDYFNLWFLHKRDLCISTAGKHTEISRI